jgi:hypothetical protein
LGARARRPAKNARRKPPGVLGFRELTAQPRRSSAIWRRSLA